MATLDVPPSGPQFDWTKMRDWLYKLWFILKGISGDGSGNVTFPGNVTVDGGLTVDGSTSLQAVTSTGETVNGNSHITGNLQVDGNINGTNSYTILLGVYSGMLGE